MIQNDSIIALATPSGIGAISVIRISGEDAINIVSKKFNSISLQNNENTNKVENKKIIL